VELPNSNNIHRYQFILRRILSGQTYPSTFELEEKSCTKTCMPDIPYLQEAMPVVIKILICIV
jgi:hypothetical protein